MSSLISFCIMLLSVAGIIIPFIASSGSAGSPLAQFGDIDLEEQHAKRIKKNRFWQVVGSALALLGIILQWWLPIANQS